MTLTSSPPVPPVDRQRNRTVLFVVIAVAALALCTGLVLTFSSSDKGNETGGATVGSGVAATSTRTVPAFTRIELAAVNNVSVTVGGPRRVVVHGDRNLLPLVTTRVHSGTLVIGASHSFTTHRSMSVIVTVPSLDAAFVSGVGQLTITGVNADRFTARVTGSGRLEATGLAKRIDVALSGVGTIDLSGLSATDVTASMSGTGGITVSATGTLDATVTGSGAVRYAGHPRVTTHITGVGTVTAV